MTGNTMYRFYNTFFQKNSFLSYDKNAFYSDIKYLRSKGFRDEENYRNKTVLELGAGKGRLTANIIELGLISNVRKYIIVEPTDGIKEVQRLCSGNAAFEFIQTDLDGLKGILKEHSIDIFIAHGVIPHIENAGGLDHIIKEMEIFLKEDGTLHIVNSFFGHPKKIANALKRRTSGNAVLSYLAAFLSIFLQ
jgi:SAM-dependent methyltransferase